MNVLLSLVVLAVFSANAFATVSQPKIQVYSRNPGIFGKDNHLICHVSDFHPPDIDITLTRNDVEIPGAVQTDLAFEKGWKFHLTKSVKFTPQDGERYDCKVRHMTNNKKISW
ncbi:beta-2 microglobulin precursor, partial [Clarias magur]